MSIHSHPLVSIVMPAYNVAHFINESITSVLSQSISDLELIVVDDGSNDNTVELVRFFAENDKRVTLICQENSGKPSVARNRGIAAARGRYLAFLDSDDYYQPGKLQSMIEGLGAHPEWVAAFHDLKLVDASGAGMGTTYLQDGRFLELAQSWLRHVEGDWWDCDERFYVFMSLRFAGAHTQSIVIARSRLAPDDLKFDPDLVICEDTDLWVRLALRGKLGFLNRTLSCYRQHGNSITRKQVLFASQVLLFHQRNFARILPRLVEAERRMYQKKLSVCFANAGYAYYDHYALSEARKAYWNAIRLGGKVAHIFSFIKACLPSAILVKLRGRS